MAIPGRNIDLGQVSAGSNSNLLAYYGFHLEKGPRLNQKRCFKFLWTGTREKEVITLVKCQSLAKPKDVGGWRLINIYLFDKALEAKTLWRIISNVRIWSQVIVKKYIDPLSLEEWIKKENKSFKNGSIV